MNQQRRPVPKSRTQQARKQAQQSRRNKLLIGGVVAVVVIVAIVISVVGGSSKKSSGLTPPTGPAAAAVVAKVIGVPATATDQVGAGTAKPAPAAVSGTPIAVDGKPEVLYVGAEYCPFCAAERWAMVNALSRFGTFTDLAFTHSSSTDVYPDTQTFTFHGSTYTSPYIAFTPVETATNKPASGGGYEPLDTPTADQQAAWAGLDPQLSFPFIDIGGSWMVSGASYDPGLLAGKSADEIATALADPTSAIAKAVLGAANALTASICATTDQQPAAVCSAAGVKAVALG